MYGVRERERKREREGEKERTFYMYACVYVCTYKTKHGRQDNCVLTLHVGFYTLHDVFIYVCMHVCIGTN